MGNIDPAELGRWFDAYAARLVLYARQWLDGGAAEDVVQDVFLHLMLERIEPGNVKAWLFRAVRNAAISATRSQHRRQHREETVAAGKAAWFEPRPGDLIDAQQAQAALANLPPLHREVVVLRLWAGMTLAEVAQTTGLPLSTVYDHYRSALQGLRTQMESSCHTKNQ